MPELKPCPACGDTPIVNADSGHVICCKIVVDDAAAWNSLPRRPDYNDVDCAGCPERRRGYLTWTTEPPKDDGWYWVRCTAADDFPIIKHVAQRDATAALLKREWAGPIPEPEES